MLQLHKYCVNITLLIVNSCIIIALYCLTLIGNNVFHINLLGSTALQVQSTKFRFFHIQFFVLNRLSITFRCGVKHLTCISMAGHLLFSPLQSSFPTHLIFFVGLRPLQFTSFNKMQIWKCCTCNE